MTSTAKRYCIIGAGACGLPVVKTFKERGIPFDCFEREADIGGLWNDASPHRVYETTHLNTSKRLSRYTDFPMPESYPQFLSRHQANEYICAYADNFDLRSAITFNTEVERVEEVDGRWEVTLSGESAPRIYDGVVIANGHHWDPKSPDYPGHFDGQCLHSHEIKSRDQIKDKRILIAGAGNSGCDLAADGAHLAKKVFHSMRRGYYFLPRFVFGRPLDVIIDLTQRWPLPRRLLRRIYSAGLYMIVGPHEKYGLPKPDHKLLECHPSSASAYLDHLAHGRITPKGDIKELKGDRVLFKDGSEEEVDLLIYATGFNVSFPFMDRRYLFDDKGRADLFLHIFHRQRDNLFLVGLATPADGGFWQLADYQAQLIASYIIAQERKSPTADWFRRHKARSHPSVDHGVTYVQSDRHLFEVQHYRYRTYIKRMLKKFGADQEATFPARARVSPVTEADEAKLRLAS